MIPIGSLYSDLDGAYYIFELVMPDPHYRSQATIIYILAARFIINFLVAHEMIRCGLFAISAGIIIVDRATKTGKILIKCCRDVDKFCTWYIQGTLLLKKIEHLVHFFVYVVMNGFFWGTVVCWWVCVKCKVSDISLPVYTVFLLAALILLVGHIVIVPMLCLGLDMAEHIVKLEKLRAELKLLKVKSWKNKITLKRANSIRPIILSYGKFWNIDREFSAEYFWLIITRTFDAILLIDN